MNLFFRNDYPIFSSYYQRFVYISLDTQREIGSSPTSLFLTIPVINNGRVLNSLLLHLPSILDAIVIP